jgi:hypothetical protein
LPRPPPPQLYCEGRYPTIIPVAQEVVRVALETVVYWEREIQEAQRQLALYNEEKKRAKRAKRLDEDEDEDEEAGMLRALEEEERKNQEIAAADAKAAAAAKADVEERAADEKAAHAHPARDDLNEFTVLYPLSKETNPGEFLLASSKYEMAVDYKWEVETSFRMQVRGCVGGREGGDESATEVQWEVKRKESEEEREKRANRKEWLGEGVSYLLYG